MTPSQLDLLLDAEARLSASADPSQRAPESEHDLIALAHKARG